jgi:hypothetical protein
MRSEARIYTHRSDDHDWTSLPMGPQWAYDLLLSQADLEHHGVIALRQPRWAAQAGDVTVQQLDSYLDILAQRRYIVVDERYGEVFVRSLLRADKIYRQPNVLRSAADRLGQVKSPAIREALHTELLRIAELADLSEPCALIVKEMLEATTAGASGRPLPRRPRLEPKASVKTPAHPSARGSANPAPPASPEISRTGSANRSGTAPPGPSAKGAAFGPDKPASKASAIPAAQAPPVPLSNADNPDHESGNPSEKPHPDGTGQGSVNRFGTLPAKGQPPRPLDGSDLEGLEAATVAITSPWLATLTVQPTSEALDDIEYHICTALIAGHRSEHIAAALSAWHASGSTDTRQLADLIYGNTEARAQPLPTAGDATTVPDSAEDWLAAARSEP